jgi:hypothetical protein
MSELIINPVGGLANRMRALTSGLALAKELGVESHIIWLRNWELNARFDDLFEMSDEFKNVNFVYPSKLKYELTYSYPRKRSLYVSKLYHQRYFGLSFFGTQNTYMSIFKNESPAVVKNMFEQSISQSDKDCFLMGCSDMYPYQNSYYRSLFIPKSSLKDRINLICEELGSNSVGLHIRRTDNAKSIANSPDQLFYDAIDTILGQNPQTKFYLATDSQATKSQFAKRYGDRIVYNPREACRGTVEGVQDAVVELFTLSSTCRILGSYYSSYSEAAAKLGDIPLRQLCV